MLLHNLVFLLLLWKNDLTVADPQTNLLDIGCSTYNATNTSLFLSNLNTTFSRLRSKLSSAAGGDLSATSELPQSAAPVYGLFFCRSYLSLSDCLACLAAAVSSTRRCGFGTGGRVIFDGCTLRYESAPFFDQGTLPGNTAVCGNGSSALEGFAAAATALTMDLSLAVPKIDEYSGTAVGDGVFGAAQCADTLSEDVCAQCLQVAYKNIQGCLPAGNGRAVDAGCFMRYSNLTFFSANQTMDLSRYLGGSGESSKNTRAIVAGVVGGVVGLLILSFLAFLWIRKSRRREDEWKGNLLGATELRGPVSFHYTDLKSATKNFSQENKLGEGGFGEVYKGILKNGNIVAVKRLAITQSETTKASFQSEVKLISNVHHRNLVRLLGCCGNRDNLLLVYEYMANGSLDKFLFGEKNELLSWKQRFDIIVGMAKGISYLHQEFHVCIIHRDIKPSNILLDDNFQPKIADFGLVRLLPGDQSHLSTKFAGTLGYTAPEYAIHGQLTEKVDTYSFGVVVLEIISGRRNSNPKLEHIKQYLLEWVWKLYEQDDLVELIDKSMNPDDSELDEIKRVMKIALLCTQSMVATRPTMSEVVVLLLSRGDPISEPARPIFIESSTRANGETSSSAWSSSATRATVSVTQFSGR
ncbi:cysteine-rich receptor-like protein kinase 2 [Dendrobium catenatum]|uniref:Cysteine-rich receptor-like protein kinase 2 n=1 Tax=Dendrobium catenatum TaxID=906689 RepID=A0A2I0XJQ2_9ASPA|nr:cysteine-rich receptor-like protein kinase 2 [Dendrobium catenatum]PKU88143.1 Cysteine-rich receptor-like protein kinase 2 [Dendrobium catenatum]